VTTLTIHFSLLIPYLFKKKLILLLFSQEKTQSSKQRERRNLEKKDFIYGKALLN